MHPIEATAVKDGQWWTVAIPDLDQSAATRRRTEVQDQAERLAATALGVDASEVTVTVVYPLPETVREDWEQIREDKSRAQELSVSADARTQAVVSALHASGYNGRDIAAMLGLSFQRISQILKTTTD